MLPTDLHGRATRMARALGISLGEFVREAISDRLGRNSPGRISDPLFSDYAAYNGDAPIDLSEHHDRHLYGGEP